MFLQRVGNFQIPRETRLEDLGGKAQRLIEVQDVARRHGFFLPEAVCLPWQTFAKVPARRRIEHGYGLRFGKYADIKTVDFKRAERDAVAMTIAELKNPFFSSSAPGEDSLKTRMAGAYSSCCGIPLSTTRDWLQSRSDKTPLPLEEEHLEDNLHRVAQVLESYFYPLPTGLRRKHGIPDTGMAILARDCVGGASGPAYSIVIQTNYDDDVIVGAIQGWGEQLVSQGKGDLFRYKRKTGRFRRRIGDQIPMYPFDLERIVNMVLSFEKDLNYPDEYGGDYELALDAEFNVALLQCPPLPKILDNGSPPRKGNLLRRVKTVKGSTDVRFERIFYFPEGQNMTSVDERRLFYLNQQLSDYLLINPGKIPISTIPILAYNALGIIDYYHLFKSGQGFSVHDNPAIDHYTTLLRAEGIGFAHAGLRDSFTERKMGTAQPDGNLVVIDIPGRFIVNEIRGQAGLYLYEK